MFFTKKSEGECKVHAPLRSKECQGYHIKRAALNVKLSKLYDLRHFKKSCGGFFFAKRSSRFPLLPFWSWLVVLKYKIQCINFAKFSFVCGTLKLLSSHAVKDGWVSYFSIALILFNLMEVSQDDSSLLYSFWIHAISAEVKLLII